MANKLQHKLVLGNIPAWQSVRRPSLTVSQARRMLFLEVVRDLI